MRKEKTVIVTSAGVATATNVISALRRSQRYTFRVVAVDADVHAPGLHLADHPYLVPKINDPSYLDKILELVSRHGVDFIFPLYSKEIELFAAARHRFDSSGARLALPSPEIVELCNDKPRFNRFLEQHRFGLPRTYGCPSEIAEFPVFLKPARGSSSVHACKVGTVEELNLHLQSGRSFMVQEYVDDREFTVDCLVREDHRVIAAVPRERIRVKDGKSVVARTVRNETIEGEVLRLLDTLCFTGPCNIQLFFDGERVRFIEVNPRLAAGGLPLAVEAGVNIPELMVRLADGESLDYQCFDDGVVMVRYLADLFLRHESIPAV